jgi:hypothetical protein
MGALGKKAAAFFKDLGCQIAATTKEPRSSTLLLQRLSVAVQRGNAACMLGTVSTTANLDELFIYEHSL